MHLAHSIGAAQVILVAGALGCAGAFKAFARTAPLAARRSALRRLTGARHVVLAFRLAGVAELAVAVTLLAAPAPIWTAAAAVLWCAAMLGYLGYAKLTAPESSCGCLNARETPIGIRSFARGFLLMAAATGAGLAATPWQSALAARPALVATVLGGEAVLFVVLSAELDHHWVLPLRRLRTRLRHPLARTRTGDDVPVQASLQQLYRSPVYRAAYDTLRSSMLDTWDEGDWRMITFAAGRGTAVFAVPRHEQAPEKVRGVLVD